MSMIRQKTEQNFKETPVVLASKTANESFQICRSIAKRKDERFKTLVRKRSSGHFTKGGLKENNEANDMVVEDINDRA